MTQRALGLSLVAMVILASGTAHGEKPTPIFVKITCIEVDFARLRALGFDWDPSVANLDAEKLHKFVRSLAENDLAIFHAEPQLQVVSGHKASLEIGDPTEKHTKLTVTPTLTDDKRIKLVLDFNLNVLHVEGQRRLSLAPTLIVEPGKVVCPVHPGLTVKADDGKPLDRGVFVFVLADTTAPELTARRGRVDQTLDKADSPARFSRPQYRAR
jgi:hypothetical protein